MKEHMPQEIEVWYVLPAIRKEFAKLMIKKGLSQREAAEKLGVTESAISQYIKEKRAKEVIAFDREIKSKMEKSVARVLEGGSLVKEMQKICLMVKNKRILCKISKKLGYAPKECRECFV
jgi:predicted transcriptional regulator